MAKLLFVLCLGLLGLACCALFYNVLGGWNLAHQEHASSDNHLTLALLTVGAVFVGALGLFETSRRILYDVQKHYLLNSSPSPDQDAFLRNLSTKRKKALSATLFLSITGVLSLITGTISHAGQLPLVHGILGLGLTALGGVSFFHWMKFFRMV